MQGFIILTIIGTEKLIGTEFDRWGGQMDGWNGGRTEIQTPISHPAISRCDKNISTNQVAKTNT